MDHPLTEIMLMTSVWNISFFILGKVLEALLILENYLLTGTLLHVG